MKSNPCETYGEEDGEKCRGEDDAAIPIVWEVGHGLECQRERHGSSKSFNQNTPQKLPKYTEVGDIPSLAAWAAFCLRID